MKQDADSNYFGRMPPNDMGNNSSDCQPSQRIADSTILLGIAKNDRSAFKDSVNLYGDRIWSVARIYTNSPKDAEILAKEIFLDIWKYAERFDLNACSGTVVIAVIARQRIRAYSN